MKLSDFEKKALLTSFEPRSLDMIKAMLVDNKSPKEVADEYYVSLQRVYILKKEFLEQIQMTPLERLSQSLEPIMKKLQVKPTDANKIKKFISSLG